MNKILVLILLSININAQWISPKKSDCTVNSKYEDDVSLCYASWEDTMLICKSLNARVPTIEELSSVVKDCEGVLDSPKNIKNKTYQECYQKKGFSNAYYFWSATADKDRKTYAQDIHFRNGTTYFSKKKNRLAIRCIKN